MNYGTFRDQVLKIINQYSIAGTITPPTYNNQQDYLNRIPALLNDAMAELCSADRFLVGNYCIDFAEGEEFGSYRRIILPEDFISIKGSGLLNTITVSPSRNFDYKLLLPDYLLLGESVKEPVVLQYYRTPRLLPSNPAPDLRLDGELEVQVAAAYYVAAHLVAGDDAFQYASLYNEYQNKKDFLKSRQSDVEVSQTEDVYGLDIMGGW